MKYIFIFLLFCNLKAQAQQTDTKRKELEGFIYQKHMVHQRSKTFHTDFRPFPDSVIVLVSDSVTISFSIPKLLSLKTKDDRTAAKYQNGMTDLRQLYSEGIDTLSLEDIEANTEKLLADAIKNGKVEQILVVNDPVTSYTCYTYGFSRRGRPALFALYNKKKLFWSYTYVICFGIRFR